MKAVIVPKKFMKYSVYLTDNSDRIPVRHGLTYNTATRLKSRLFDMIQDFRKEITEQVLDDVAYHTAKSEEDKDRILSLKDQ